MGESFVGDGINVVTVGEERLFVAALAIAPCDGAGAISFDAGGFVFWETSAGEDHVLGPDDGAAGGLGGERGFPVEFAGARVVARELACAGDEELFFSGDGGDDGGAPVVVASTWSAPDGGAVFGFDSHDFTILGGADDDDESFFVEDGGGAVAEFVARLVVTDGLGPDDFAGWADCGGFDFVVILEDDDDVGAIPLGGL